MTDAELRRLAEAVSKAPRGWHWRDTALNLAVNADAILALLDRIEAVRALHVPEVGWSPPECQVCGDGPWPCPTISALDGEP